MFASFFFNKYIRYCETNHLKRALENNVVLHKVKSVLSCVSSSSLQVKTVNLIDLTSVNIIINKHDTFDTC